MYTASPPFRVLNALSGDEFDRLSSEVSLGKNYSIYCLYMSITE